MKHSSILICCLIFLSSCAIKNDYAEVNHQVKKTAAIIHQNKQPVQVKVLDEREEKQVVGYKQNSLGMKTAKVYPKESLVSTFTKALQDELIQKGFIVSENGLKLLVSINRCYVDYEDALFFARSVADLQLEIHVLNEQSEPLFNKKLTVKGVESPIFRYSGKNVAKAISNALDLACNELTLDQRFIGALLGIHQDKMIAQEDL